MTNKIALRFNDDESESHSWSHTQERGLACRSDSYLKLFREHAPVKFMISFMAMLMAAFAVGLGKKKKCHSSVDVVVAS